MNWAAVGEPAAFAALTVAYLALGIPVGARFYQRERERKRSYGSAEAAAYWAGFWSMAVWPVAAIFWQVICRGEARTEQAKENARKARALDAIKDEHGWER